MTRANIWPLSPNEIHRSLRSSRRSSREISVDTLWPVSGSEIKKVLTGLFKYLETGGT
jgi:hypothetical protein